MRRKLCSIASWASSTTPISWTNFDHRNNGAAAAFFTLRPTTQFEFNLEFEHYEVTQTTPPGSGQIPVITATRKFGSYVYPLTITKPLDLPRSFSDSDPTMWTNFPYIQHRTLYGFDWTYKLDDKWKISNRFHYLADDETQTGFSGTNFQPGHLRRDPKVHRQSPSARHALDKPPISVGRS